MLMLGAAACGEPSSTASTKQAEPAPPRSALSLRFVDPPALEGSLALNPATAGDAVIATWIEPSGGDAHRVRFARLEHPARRWSAASTVLESAELLASSVDFPVAAQAASGAYYVTLLMRGREPHASFVHLATSRDGREWRVLGPVHDDATETEHGHASLFVEGGDVRAVWLDGRAWVEGGPMAIRSAAVAADGTMMDASVVDPRVCDCCQTAGVATAEGTFVAYRDRDESELRDIATVRRIDGGWTSPRTVHEDGWTIRGCPVNGPQAAALGRRVALAWYTEAGGAPRVRVAFSEDAGARFGAPIDVDASRPIGRVDVEWADDGTALVSWLGAARPDGELAVLLRRVAPDRRVGAIVEAAHTGSSRPAGVPRLARLGPDVVLAWTEAGPPRRVRVAVVDPDDVPAPARVQTSTPEPSPGPMQVGAPLPDLALTDLDGTPVSLASLNGRPLVLSFFATWCEPCRQEYPLLSRLAREHGERIRVVGVSLDEAPLSAVADHARAHQLTYTVLHDARGASARPFGVPPIPATFVFDADGALVWRHAGGGAELLRELPGVAAATVEGRRGQAAGGGHDHEH